LSLINIEKTIELDVYDHDTTPSVIKTIQLDTGTRTVYAVIQNSRQDYDIGQNASVSLTVLRPDKTKVQITGETFVSYTGAGGDTYGAKAELSDVALAVKGNLKAQFKITSGEQELRTEIFAINNGEALDAGDGDWAGDLDGHNLDEMAESIETLQTDMTAVNEDVSDLKSGFSDLYNTAYVTDSASGATANFIDGADDVPVKSLKVNIDPIQLGSGDPSPDNIRPIRGWDAVKVYHSGENTEEATEYYISLTSAGTVYGGTLDVVSGELTVDKAIVDLGTLNWVLENGVFRLNTDIGAKKETNQNAVANMVCSNYKTISQKAMSNADSSVKAIAGLNWSNGVRVLDGSYSTALAFKTAMAGVQLVYELATPTVHSLTPTEIKSLLSINNVWSDAGDVEVEYRADTKLYIDKRLAEVTA